MSAQRLLARHATLVAALGAAACHTSTSALRPAGPESGRIFGVWNVFFAVSIVVWTAVVLATVYALARRRATRASAEELWRPTAPDPREERRATRVVGVALALTVACLYGLLVTSISAGHAIATLPTDHAVQIRVVGHQWWWEVHYPGHSPNESVLTANEIHIPVGRPIAIELESRDVIHSFWVPELTGKRDLIPGHTSHLLLRADRAGRYRGECAEFCGYQHANMGFYVVAEPDAQFNAWIEHQRAPGRAATSDAERRGRHVLETRSCVLCHAVRGTRAGGGNGPDLTHVMSRQTLAGGAIANTRGHLAGWIVDPQSIKPGALMPPAVLPADELSDLLNYLESLQ